MFGAMALLGAVFFLLGRGLRRLRRGVRGPTIALAGLGLLGFPLGTLINGYILWLMLSKKGQLVFSPEYAAVDRGDAADQVSNLHSGMDLPGVDRGGDSRGYRHPDAVALRSRLLGIETSTDDSGHSV